LITCSIGTLASGGSATFVISARTTVPGLLTDIAGVSGNQNDVNVANNSHSAKTSVGMIMTYARLCNEIVISWPSAYTDVTVEYSDVIEPAVWMPVTQVPMQSGGTNTIILTTTEAQRFYRMTAP
jgi:hypothetical protein